MLARARGIAGLPAQPTATTAWATQNDSTIKPFNFWKEFFDPSVTTSTLFTDSYAWARYGNIPAPNAAGAPIPAPGAPQTVEQMTAAPGSPDAYTTEQSATDSQSNFVKAFQDYIASSEASGDYNPAGTGNPTSWSVVLIAGAVLVGGGWVLSQVARRY